MAFWIVMYAGISLWVSMMWVSPWEDIIDKKIRALASRRNTGNLGLVVGVGVLCIVGWVAVMWPLMVVKRAWRLVP